MNAYLPMKLHLIMGKIAELSSHVRAIELRKRRKKSEADESALTRIPQEVNSPQSDAIMKAILESILNEYNVYLRATDTMRIKVGYLK